ncbi:MAG: AMP-binding protein [Bacteroidota bacterium]
MHQDHLLYQELKTPLDYFYHWEQEEPERTFLRQPYGSEWKTLSYAQAGQEARRLCAAMQAKGLRRGDHIGMLSKNCYHWILADLAIMMGGFVSVPYYASLPKRQLREVILKSDIRLLFVGKLETWGDKIEAVPAEVEIVRFPHYQGNAEVPQGEDWEALLAAYPPIEGQPRPALDDLWTILFTSGTTGSPKGVMHSFRNPALVIRGEQLSHFIGLFQISAARCFSFLPLNHVGERIGVETSCLAMGGSISFAESIDTFLQNLQDTQPTIFFAVPRIWTKFYQGVITRLPAGLLNVLLQVPLIAGFLRRRIRTALGLRDVEIAATGAAITPAYLKRWYRALGIHLIEAYGMTEVCGTIANSPQLNAPPDAVGTTMPFCQIKVHPRSGEVLLQAPYNMIGYYKDPVKTKEVLREGWIHSGDRGTMDEQGYLRIIGRVKDAFKTAKGLYILPNPMEEELARSQYIEQICIAGLGIKQPIALINLSDIGKTLSKDNLERELKKELDRLNKRLPNYQRIITLVIDTTTWTEANQLLTPTLKVRRGKLDDFYGKKYKSWEEAREAIVWI